MSTFTPLVVERVHYMVEQAIKVERFSWNLLLEELKALQRQDLFSVVVKLQDHVASKEQFAKTGKYFFYASIY